MFRSVRWMALTSLLLLCVAGGMYYLAEHKEKATVASADQTTFSGLAPDTNRWHVFALLAGTAGLALGGACVMVIRQEHREDHLTINANT